MRRSTGTIVALLTQAILLVPDGQFVLYAQQPAGRPRVGLALGGGAARGLAHVGVLEWLEEHRIPVDAIAGTSMGGLVGGGYATGRSAAEVRAMVEGIDWDRMFRGEVDYAQKSFRRKEDRRAYPVRPEFGLRGGLRLAPGLDPGHEVELFLSRVALPHAAPLAFDDLPIPFRAIATDLEKAAVAELGSGSLASALRATMAIPGVFPPVERDGLLLVDGALLNNVPADVVRQMGVDVVIAVDVAEPLMKREELQSLVSVANQALGVMMAERTRSVLGRHADHVIKPALDDVSTVDFREFDTIRALGYAAAAAAGDALAHLALSTVDWDQYLKARRARKASSPVEPRFVRVQGVNDREVDDIAHAVKPILGKALDPEELDLRLSRLAGRGRYGSLGYDLLRDGDRTGIGIRARNKPHGPPFLNLALEAENRADDLEFAVGTRLTVLDAGTRDAEFRFDLALGPDAGAVVEYYLPVSGSSWFLVSSLDANSRRQGVAVDGDRTTSYRTSRVRAGTDLGLSFGSRSELRVGYEFGTVDFRALDGPLGAATGLPDGTGGVEHGVRVRWVYDGHDHWLVPRRGTRFETEARWLATAPEHPAGFAQARFKSNTFFQAGQGGRVFVALAGSTASDDRLTPLYLPTLGGPFRLGAFDRDQFQGVSTVYTGAGYLHQLGRLPDLIGGPIHAGVCGSNPAARSMVSATPTFTPVCRPGCWSKRCSARCSPASASATMGRRISSFRSAARSGSWIKGASPSPSTMCSRHSIYPSSSWRPPDSRDATGSAWSSAFSRNPI